MAYDWHDDIDGIVWRLEAAIERAAAGSGLLGHAPSAGDEVRRRLDGVRTSVSPQALLAEAAKLDRAKVDKALEELSKAAVKRAVGRGAKHVAREDVGAALDAAPSYPFKR